jgi:hypothetical protein
MRGMRTVRARWVATLAQVTWHASAAAVAEQRVGRGSLVGHDQAMGFTVLPIEVRDRLADAELTYHELGATRGDLPAGYHQFTKPVPARVQR